MSETKHTPEFVGELVEALRELVVATTANGLDVKPRRKRALDRAVELILKAEGSQP